MAFELDFPEDAPADRPSASRKGGALTLDWPTEPLEPKPESFGWTLYEAAKMTASDIGGAVAGAGKAVADVILPPDPTKPSLGERVVGGVTGALTPPATMEADLKTMAPKEKVSTATVSTDVVERPPEAQGPEAILKGARKVAGVTGVEPTKKGKAEPRGPDLSYTVFDTPEDTAQKVLKRSAMGFSQGVWATVKGLVAVEPLLESLVGLDTPIGKLAKENVFPRIDEIIEQLSPDDPNFVDALASGIGSMATFFVPGMATAKIMQGIAKASPTLALWAGTGVHTVLEAGVEAGNSYAELSKAGYSEAEAATRANRVFWQNMALLAVTNKLGIYGEGRGIPKRSVMSALMEGTQEFTQEIIQSRQEDPDSIFKDPVFTRERLQRYLQSGAVGAIIGGGIGGVRAVSEQRAERAANKEEYASLVPDAKAKVTEEEWGWLVRNGQTALRGRGYSEADATLGAEVGAARYINMNLAAEEAGGPAVATPTEIGEVTLDFPEEAPTAQSPVLAAPAAPSEAPIEAPRPAEAEVVPAGPGEAAGRTPGLAMPVEPGDAVRQAEANLKGGATPAEIEAEVNRIMGVPVEAVPAEAPGAAAAVGETGPEAPAPPAPLKGESTVPREMTFEKTAVGPQAIIPGAETRAMPMTAIRRGDRGVSDLPLVEAGRETGRQADLPAGEALDPQRAAIQEWLADQLGSGPQMSLATAKSAQLMPAALRAKLQNLGIDPTDAWDVTHAETPRAGAIARILGVSIASESQETPAVAAAPIKMLPGGVAQDYNSVNTRDPLEVDQFIRGVGGLNPTAYTAELADVPLYLKNTKAEQTIDTLARDIAEAQGRDQYEIVNELLDSLRALAGKKAEAATKPWNQPVPPKDMGVSATEWQAMSASERQALWEFSDAMARQAIPEMEAAFIGTAPELAISEAVEDARVADVRPTALMTARIYDTLRDLAATPDRAEQVIDTYLKMATLVTNDPTVRAMTKPEDRTPAALWESARKKVQDEITQGTDSRRQPGDDEQAREGRVAEDRGIATAPIPEPPAAAAVEPGRGASTPAPVPAGPVRGGERTVRPQAVAAPATGELAPAVRRDVEAALTKLGYKKREMTAMIATALSASPAPTTAEDILTAIYSAPREKGAEVERMATSTPAGAPATPVAPTLPPPQRGLLGGLFRGRQAVTSDPRKDQLMQSLAKAFRMAKAGALVMQGDVRGKGVRGWRHKISGNIHLRKGTDVDTVAHEVGHALQRDGLHVTFKELVPFKNEMVALTQVLGIKDPNKMSEGFAEFSRLYMTDPALARQTAPTFYPWFEARLSTMPVLEAAVQTFRDEVVRLRAKNPIERIRAGFAFERGGRTAVAPPKTLGEQFRYGMRRLITDYWNRAVPLREVVEAIDPTGNLLAATEDPHKRYKTLGARIAAVGGSFIKKGIVDAQTGRVLPGSKGYYDIVKPVAEHQEDYTIYEVIRKIQDLETSALPQHRSAAENLMKLFDVTAADLIQARQDLEGQYPHFAGVLGELQTFNDGVLQYLIDTGQYSQKAIDTIRDSRDIYVPLGRLMDQGEAGAGSDAFMTGRPLRRIRGTSQRIVLPTLVERARQIYTIVGAAERNLVAAKLADALESAGAAGQMLGTYMDKVPTPVSVTTTQIGAFRDAIQAAFIQAGGDPAVFDQVDWSTLVQIFQPDLSNLKRNQLIIWRNGEAEVWQVYDQAMMLALRQMDRSMVRPWVDAMGWGASVLFKMATAPVRWLHGGVVHAPDFVVAHLTRQVQEEAAQGYFMPRFIAGTIGKDIEEIKRRWRSGGGQVFHFVSLDSQSIQRNLDDLRFGHWYEGGVRRSARELFAKFDDVTRWFDQAGRVGVARTVIEHPRPVDVLEGELSVNIDAAFKAREAGGDYEQAGNSVFWRFFSSTIPFVRAAQTHIYRTNRNFKEAFDAVRRREWENPKVRGILITGGAMLLLEMLSYLYLADDVRWKQTEDWEKSLYYHWTWPWQARVTQAQWDAMTDVQKKVMPGLSRAPKSFFMSWLFATLPRQVSEYAHDNDPEAFNKMLEKLTESFLLSNHMTLMPGALKPAYDISRNKNPLSGAPLNPRRLEGLPPEEQAQFYTPEVARRASEILQKIPVVKNLHLTPIDIDHLVRGYTGYAGQYTEAALDSLGRALSGAEAIERPATRWYEQMAIRRFVSRFPNARTQQLNDFYSAYHESQETLALLRKKIKEGKSSAEIERLKADREFDPEMTGQLMGAAKMFNFYRKSMENVVRSQRDAETKRHEVDRLLRLELDTATKVMDIVNKRRLEQAAIQAR